MILLNQAWEEFPNSPTFSGSPCRGSYLWCVYRTLSATCHQCGLLFWILIFWGNLGFLGMWMLKLQPLENLTTIHWMGLLSIGCHELRHIPSNQYPLQVHLLGGKGVTLGWGKGDPTLINSVSLRLCLPGTFYWPLLYLHHYPRLGGLLNTWSRYLCILQHILDFISLRFRYYWLR